MSTKHCESEHCGSENCCVDTLLDIDSETLENFTKLCEEQLNHSVGECSFTIWLDECRSIKSVEDLQTLLGKCLLNEIIVQVILNKLESMEEVVEGMEELNDQLRTPG